jgi:hypothetical protein
MSLKDIEGNNEWVARLSPYRRCILAAEIHLYSSYQ